MSAAVTNVEVGEVLDGLRHNCQPCRNARPNITRAQGDLRGYLRKAARSEQAHTYHAETIATLRRELRVTVDTALLHLSEPHEDEVAPDEPPRTRRVAKPDTRALCPSCGGRAVSKGENQIGAHKSPAGSWCPRRLLSVSVDAPPVTLPPEPRWPSPSAHATPAASRLDVGSECNECGKWLPGERSLCGRCYVKRSHTQT